MLKSSWVKEVISDKTLNVVEVKALKESDDELKVSKMLKEIQTQRDNNENELKELNKKNSK